ncbi:MAG: hypothetical protein PHE59_00330 [Patescibacteria group bacterium]|nr:hypothetical protein [Patescibacteria group bacterium]MDD5164300.1 hypothetical protein [Patescibacteria group bacterium]MDD5534746.1 hypothetical protein [Patescibacteria group bacterium]
MFIIKNSKKYIIFLFCIFIFSFCILNKVNAATLYLEPKSGEYKIGDTFIIEARLNLEAKENINVVEANLKYPQDLLEVVDLSFGDSLLTIIPQKPTIDKEKGIINFVGGIPGGYSGHIAGDPGLSNSLVKMIFKVREITPDQLSANGQQTKIEINFLDNSELLLNDGKGTLLKPIIQGTNLTILANNQAVIKDEWSEILKEDKALPEPFTVEIKQDPLIFNNKYFIIFSTTDKQSGLKYYEISETQDKNQENWNKGESPYLLTDQNLNSIIKVRAVDMAGNMRTEIIVPSQPTKKTHSSILLIILLVLIIFCYLLFFINKRNRKS